MASSTKTENSATVTTNREDDDDLEALRLAALLSRKSIKEGANVQPASIPSSGASSHSHFNKKQFTGLFQQENHRNNFGPPNKWSRQRSSNLIVINPVPLEEPKPQVHKKEVLPKLILPQDKWCPSATGISDKVLPDSSGPGKFSRIHSHSDDSEDSDSEVEDSRSETDDIEMKNSASEEELTVDGDNESSSDFLVTQEQDILDNIDSQPVLNNNKKVPNNAETFVADTGSTSSDQSDSSDVDENVENVSKVSAASKEDRTNGSRTRNLYQSSQKLSPPKKPLDLREVLKAKRDVKNSSDYESDDEKSVRPVSSSLKSVLSVVKRSPQRNSDLNKKLSSRHTNERLDAAKTSANERTAGRSVFLTLDQPNKRSDKVNSDGMQVTVVTGPHEEKKGSVHMRLGLKNTSRSPSKSKIPVTSRLGLAAASLRESDGDDDGPATDNFANDQGRGNRRRRKRRSLSSTRSKRSRNSGFRGSKESERDAKIRRIEKVNTVRR